MKRMNLSLSDELHKRFKIACSLDGKRLSEVVRASILTYVEVIERKFAQKKK